MSRSAAPPPNPPRSVLPVRSPGPRPGGWARRPPRQLALAAWALGLLTIAAGCRAANPGCRQAMAELRRQETLAAMASPGGVDPQALQQAQMQRQRACGF